jgi:acyl-CoA synthetase (AMP-forming)/AMP-acid ligase II
MPLPPSFGEYELEQILGRSGSRFVVCDADRTEVVGRVAARLGSPVQVLGVRDVTEAAAVTRAAGVRDGDPRRIVEIAVTSGTSGLPKLASRSAAQKQATFEGFTGRLGIAPGDRVLAMSPLTQGVGSMSLFTFRRGATQVLLGTSRFVPADVLRLAQAERVTTLLGVPTNLTRLLAAPELAGADLSACRITAVAGALLPPDVAEAWERRTGSRVCIFYGSVDAGQLAVCSPADSQDKRWHSVGRPHDCCEVRIRGADGEALGVDAIGEICMRGATVQDGYWGESRSAHESDGWAHLGDLGYLDRDGYPHVVGRTKDIIIRGGSNINPYEVEAVLRRHPDIADVCIVGKPDPDLGERAVAFVVLAPGRRLSIDQLRQFLAAAGLAKYKWPEFVEAIAEIPLSGPGKVNREALRANARRETGETIASLP